MKKSEVIDIIDRCYPRREMFEKVYIPATQSISELTYLAAFNMNENIKQAVLEYEDSEAGEWERLGKYATVCSKCGKGLDDSHGYGFVLNEFKYCPFCGREMKVRENNGRVETNTGEKLYTGKDGVKRTWGEVFEATFNDDEGET